MTANINILTTGPRPLSTDYDHDRYNEIQAFLPKPGQRFALPPSVTKAAAMETIMEVLRAQGAGETVIAVWRKIAMSTKAAAWQDNQSLAINWRPQCEMAKEMHITPRRFRQIEAKLQSLGVLARTTAQNGFRGYRSGKPEQDGLSLEPALANYMAISALAAHSEWLEEERVNLVQDARRARRRCEILVSSIEDTEHQAWALNELKAVDARRPTPLRSAEMEAVQEWMGDLLDFESRVLGDMDSEGAAHARVAETSPALSELADIRGESHEEEGENSPKNTGDGKNISGAAEISFPSHKQGEIHKYNCSGKPPDSEQTDAAKGREDAPVKQEAGDKKEALTTPYKRKAPGPNAEKHLGQAVLSFADRRRKKQLSKIIDKNLWDRLESSPDLLVEIASDDARMYVESCGLQRAASLICRELGIHPSAWQEAVSSMTEGFAFIALLVVDRNRFHPTKPIKEPGGALRHLARLASRGELELTRSIYGIIERTRRGEQPKA